ncbi:MAG: hypothetical protein KBB78_03295 [Candidatus Pacebacteria bacterium]|nr:hypothetical protein [Candidatus Paceibacterota bacterium]
MRWKEPTKKQNPTKRKTGIRKGRGKEMKKQITIPSRCPIPERNSLMRRSLFLLKTSLINRTRVGGKRNKHERRSTAVVSLMVFPFKELDKLDCLSSDNRIAPFVKFVKKGLIK